jgi:hypothetical protein
MGTELSRASRRERRAFLRHPYPKHLAIPWLALVGPNHWAATIVNISVVGLAIVSAHTYPAGFEMKIEFRARISDSWHAKRVRVIHCTPQGKHAWMLGTLFVEPFTVEEFQALLPDRRR